MTDLVSVKSEDIVRNGKRYFDRSCLLGLDATEAVSRIMFPQWVLVEKGKAMKTEQQTDEQIRREIEELRADTREQKRLLEIDKAKTVRMRAEVEAELEEIRKKSGNWLEVLTSRFRQHSPEHVEVNS